MTRWLDAAPVALVLAACGGDGGGAKAEPVTDPQALQSATAAARSTSALTALQPSATSQSARSPLTTVATALQSFAGRYDTTKTHEAALTLEQAEQSADMFELQDGHLIADVVYGQGSPATKELVVDMKIAKGFTGWTLDGTFDVHYVGHTAQVDADDTYEAVFDTLQLDTMYCPFGGGFTLDYSVKQGGSGSLSVEFGPRCGDVKVEGT
jgi:hypothetical protein